MKILLALILLVIAIPASSQSFEHCDSVLNYTGREQKLSTLSTLDVEYAQRIASKARELSITTPNWAADAESKAKSQSSEYRESRKSAFDHSDVVFGPAVEAWTNCIMAARDGQMRVTPSVVDEGKVLSITITPSVGSGRLLQGVNIPTGLTCKGTGFGKELSRNMNVELPAGQITNLRCERTGGTTKALTVGVVTGGNAYNFKLPTVAGETRMLDEKSTVTLLALSASRPCTKDGVIPGVSYPRQIRATAKMGGTFHSEESVGSVTVTLNGTSIISKTQRKQSNWTPRGEISDSYVGTLDAFTPVRVELVGGIGPNGTCEYSEAKIVGPA